MNLSALVRETYREPHALPWILQEHKGRAQAWRVGRTYSTIRLDTGRVFRKAFEPVDTLCHIAEDLASAERDPFVSSWGGVWRSYAPMPGKLGSLPASLLAKKEGAVNPRKPYPWIEQRMPGDHPGVWQEWDISSAYAWASALGLPDPRSIRRSDRKTISDTGLYLVDGPLIGVHGEPEWYSLPTWARWKDPREMAEGYKDYRRKRSRLAWVPGEFMNKLGLEPKRVRVALEWSRTTEFVQTFDKIRNDLPRWFKNVFRAHWGDWGSSAPVWREIWDNGRCIRTIPMPRGLACEPWAIMVQSRVTGRVAESAEHAARIFIDSSLLPEEVTPRLVGKEMGYWKRKVRFPNGVQVRPLPYKPVATSALRCRTCRKYLLVDASKVVGVYRCFRCRTGKQ